MLQTRTSSNTSSPSVISSPETIDNNRLSTACDSPVHPPGLRALFNSLAHGIWVVDAQRYVHYANPIAQQTNQLARCLQLSRGMLQAVHTPDQAALEHSVHKATQINASGHSSAVRSVLRLRVVDAKPPTDMLMLITPLQGTDSDPLLNIYYEKYSYKSNKYAGLAAIQLQKNSLIDPAMLCLLARSYKLTPTEELVLSLLCDGLDAPEVASTLSVAISTVRSHVRGLCSKMQTCSIRQLIIKVALLPGAAGVRGMV